MFGQPLNKLFAIKKSLTKGVQIRIIRDYFSFTSCKMRVVRVTGLIQKSCIVNLLYLLQSQDTTAFLRNFLF